MNLSISTVSIICSYGQIFQRWRQATQAQEETKDNVFPVLEGNMGTVWAMIISSIGSVQYTLPKHKDHDQRKTIKNILKQNQGMLKLRWVICPARCIEAILPSETNTLVSSCFFMPRLCFDTSSKEVKICHCVQTAAADAPEQRAQRRWGMELHPTGLWLTGETQTAWNGPAGPAQHEPHGRIIITVRMACGLGYTCLSHHSEGLMLCVELRCKVGPVGWFGCVFVFSWQEKLQNVWSVRWLKSINGGHETAGLMEHFLWSDLLSKTKHVHLCKKMTISRSLIPQPLPPLASCH